MIATNAYKNIVQSLSEQYSERESNSIAKILFEDLLGVSYTNDIDLKKDQLESLRNALAELQELKPIQYITNRSNFYGYDFYVDDSVLIPRPETEELVYWMVRDLKKDTTIKSVLDIGTGSGCIPISLKKNIPRLNISGIDSSKSAITVAKLNAILLDVKVSFKVIDLFDNQAGAFIKSHDVIVSNPPYITLKEKSKMKENVYEYEPNIALFVDDDDPLLFYKKILTLAKEKDSHVKWVYFEINEFYKDSLEELLQKEQLPEFNFEKDLQSKWRMLRVKI